MRKSAFVFLILMIASISLADTLYVDTAGSDSWAGTKVKPLKTLGSAINKAKDAGANTVIRMGKGVFPIHKTYSLPSGLTLEGEGSSLTTVRHISGDFVARYFNFSGDGLTIKNIFFDGVDKRLRHANGFLQVDTAKNVTIQGCRIEKFHWGALACRNTTNLAITDCTFKNNGNGTTGGDYANLNLGFITNGIVRNCVIHEEGINGVGGKGIGGRGLVNVLMDSLTIIVPHKGLWNNQGAPAICIEFWSPDSLVKTSVEISNSYFNNTLSFVRMKPQVEGQPSVRVHHCTIKALGYALEAASSHIVLDNNYIEGGPWAIANWGGVPCEGLLIHNNVFIDTTANRRIRWGRFHNFRMYNNTVVTKYTRSIFTDESDSLSWDIKNNIFYNTQPESGLPVLSLSDKGITNNLFYNFRAVGSNVVTANPQFLATGSIPFPYYGINKSSPAHDKGIRIDGITEGFSGLAPDIGAYEYRAATALRPVILQKSSPAALNSLSGNASIYMLTGRVVAGKDRPTGIYIQGGAYHSTLGKTQMNQQIQ